MSRLSVQLDGAPAYLYVFIQGRFDDRCQYLCAHRERMTPEEVRARFAEAVKRLPLEIEHYDYMASPRAPDLFERALVLAGFESVGSELEGGLWLRGAHAPVTERGTLEWAEEQER